jgi:polyphosphate kinase 2 (PPK2 family)
MLENLDLTLSIDKETYESELVHYQVALNKLGYQVYVQRRPVIMVFEGWDAAGKGGAIKRVTEKLDPRGYVVYPIAAPHGDDATHHYLWRFWRRLPELGQIAIFDRSWYGRVMVERIEGFCKENEWKRSYREINEFEHQLVDYGTVIFKFWFHISKDEQLARFEGRSGDKLRSWKLTDEDWRNRDKWDVYVQAVEDMILKTSTLSAPWTLVEGNSKNYARIKVLRTIVEGLSGALKFDPFTQVAMDEDKKKSKKQSRKK